MRSARGPSDAAAAARPVEWDPQPAEFQLQITGNAQAGYTIGGVVRRDGHAHAFADVLFVTAALIVWRPAAPGRLPADRRVRHGRRRSVDGWAAGRRDGDGAGGAGGDAPRDTRRPRILRASSAPTSCASTRASNSRSRASASRAPADYARLPPCPALASTRRCRSAYGDCDVDAWSVQPVFFDRERRLAWRRDLAAERAALARLQALGVRRLADWQTGGTRLDLADSAAADHSSAC